MGTKVHPPLSDAVVEIPDEKVDAYTAAGWTAVKTTRTRKADSEDKK